MLARTSVGDRRGETMTDFEEHTLLKRTVIGLTEQLAEMTELAAKRAEEVIFYTEARDYFSQQLAAAKEENDRLMDRVGSLQVEAGLRQLGEENALADLAAMTAARDEAREEVLAALVLWVEQRWEAEVKHRPMENVHRRTLDGTWQQVLAKLAELRKVGK